MAGPSEQPLSSEHIPEICDSVPLQALSFSTREKLYLYLRPVNLLGNDWRMLAEKLGCDTLEIENFNYRANPVEEVFYYAIKSKNLKVGEFLSVLQSMERLDILDGCGHLIENDVKQYKPVQVAEVSSEQPAALTIGDLAGSREYFDAFVSCHRQDIKFCQELIDKLEVERGFKLCVVERDVMPGVLQSPTVAELIQKRCKRAIIVISKNYGGSDEEHSILEWQVQFAQALAPIADRNMHKLIPIKIDSDASTPPILLPYNISDFSREAVKEWFWRRLEASLAAPTNKAGGYEGPPHRLGRNMSDSRDRAHTTAAVSNINNNNSNNDARNSRHRSSSDTDAPPKTAASNHAPLAQRSVSEAPLSTSNSTFYYDLKSLVPTSKSKRK